MSAMRCLSTSKVYVTRNVLYEAFDSVEHVDTRTKRVLRRLRSGWRRSFMLPSLKSPRGSILAEITFSPNDTGDREDGSCSFSLRLYGTDDKVDSFSPFCRGCNDSSGGLALATFVSHLIAITVLLHSQLMTEEHVTKFAQLRPLSPTRPDDAGILREIRSLPVNASLYRVSRVVGDVVPGVVSTLIESCVSLFDVADTLYTFDLLDHRNPTDSFLRDVAMSLPFGGFFSGRFKYMAALVDSIIWDEALSFTFSLPDRVLDKPRLLTEPFDPVAGVRSWSMDLPTLLLFSYFDVGSVDQHSEKAILARYSVTTPTVSYQRGSSLTSKSTPDVIDGHFLCVEAVRRSKLSSVLGFLPGLRDALSDFSQVMISNVAFQAHVAEILRIWSRSDIGHLSFSNSLDPTQRIPRQVSNLFGTTKDIPLDEFSGYVLASCMHAVRGVAKCCADFLLSRPERESDSCESENSIVYLDIANLSLRDVLDARNFSRVLIYARYVATALLTRVCVHDVVGHGGVTYEAAIPRMTRFVDVVSSEILSYVLMSVEKRFRATSDVSRGFLRTWADRFRGFAEDEIGRLSPCYDAHIYTVGSSFPRIAFFLDMEFLCRRSTRYGEIRRWSSRLD